MGGYLTRDGVAHPSRLFREGWEPPKIAPWGRHLASAGGVGITPTARMIVAAS
jgi:hypothetical protein